jgi:hypothetical protein
MARRTAEWRAAAEAARPEAKAVALLDAMDQDAVWHGWRRPGESCVGIGPGVMCAGCGYSVAVIFGYPPEPDAPPEPVWPYEQDVCPVCVAFGHRRT